MKRTRSGVDPLIWPLFGAGFFVVALIYPGWTAVVGICDVMGWLPADALSFERVHGWVARPVGVSAAVGTVILSSWNGAFHLRHTVMDLCGSASDRIAAPLLYGAASLGSALAVLAGARLCL